MDKIYLLVHLFEHKANNTRALRRAGNKPKDIFNHLPALFSCQNWSISKLGWKIRLQDYNAECLWLHVEGQALAALLGSANTNSFVQIWKRSCVSNIVEFCFFPGHSLYFPIMLLFSCAIKRCYFIPLSIQTEISWW